MGGLGHSEVFLAWGIPFPNYIKSLRSHITVVQMLFMEGHHFVRCSPQGDRMVPPPHEWPSLIQKVHSEFGHFGIKRTYSILTPHYHWRGMYVQIQDIIVRWE
jgi:hypothetical protein